MKKQAGIYRITIARGDLPPKNYIGQSIFMNQRIRVHLRDLRGGKHYNIHFQRAFDKYGEHAVTFSPIIVCEPKKEILQMYEQAVVDSMDPDLIFNIRLECVVSNLGIPASEEQKTKVSAAITGTKRSLDTRERIAAAQAWKRTPEGRARCAAVATGKVASDATRKKMSNSQLARNLGNRVLKLDSSWILYGGG